MNPAGQQSPRSSLHHVSEQHLDSDDAAQAQSGDDEYDDQHENVRNGKRKRPISVSCELCKQRKVKCDRGQPSCGWCSRNGALCEYKERKKPGLRAGYGRELEQRLDRLEEVLHTHSEILQASMAASSRSPTSGGSGHGHALFPNHAASSVKGSNTSLPSDHGTPREPAAPSVFARSGTEGLRAPQAETALFLQKPSTYHSHPAASSSSQGIDFAAMPSSVSGISPTDMATAPIPPTPAAQEYYGTGPRAAASHQPLHSPAVGAMSQAQGQITSDQDLPPYDLLYALVDLYFKYINTWCPILHRKTTLDSFFGPTMVEETDRILLHAIVAATLRYSADTRLTDERRRHYHDVSKQRVVLYGMEHSSVKTLQALVILALDLCGSGNGPPGWNIMALITRSVVQLGLAVESNSLSVSPNYTSIYTLRAMILPEPRDFVEEESRRRLFWMVYLLDRYATISTAFEFALDDREIDRTLPCRDDLWIKNQKVETRWFRIDDGHTHDDNNPENTNGGAGLGSNAGSPEHEVDRPENLGAFSYYIEILGILSKIHKFLKRPVDISALSDVESWQMRYKALDNLLAAWKFGLPGEYGNMAKLFQPGSAKTLNCGWVMLHATYHTAVIRLHSSAAYPTTRSPIFTPSYSASQRCHAAVENITALGEFVVAHGLLVKLGPPFAFTLWVAARVLLVHGSTVEHKVSPQIAFLVDSLRDMGRYWPVAARYCELLQRVLDEHRDSERHGDRVTPSSVKILADMRRTAFDLDLLISRQPRNPPGGGALTNAPSSHNNHHLNNNTSTPGGPGWPSRLPSITPARTPAPNELEYLDVFDFFNVPRLPFAPGAPAAETAAGGGTSSLTDTADSAHGNGAGGEFNITDFMVDANRDWLFKQDTAPKFMS